MAIASSAKRSGASSSVVVLASVIGSVIGLLRGFDSAEVVADEILERDRHLLLVERRLREVVEEIEDGPIRDDAVVVEPFAAAAAGLLVATVAAAAGDEVGVAGLTEALRIGQDAVEPVDLEDAVALRGAIEAAGAEA